MAICNGWKFIFDLKIWFQGFIKSDRQGSTMNEKAVLNYFRCVGER